MKTGATWAGSGQTSFERVLDELERADVGSAQPRGAGPLGVVFATFAPPIDVGQEVGHEAGTSATRWNWALDWIADPPEFAAAKTAAPGDSPDAIAAELGLGRVLTREQLKRARRRFMWENHPDRRPDAPEIANRRVAIANMLIDRAEDALRNRRAS